MLCTIRKEQKQNLGTKAEPSWWRSVLPSPAGSSSSLKYELFLCRRPASQGRGEGMLACLMQAGRELGRVSHFLSDLAGMMQDEPAFHVTVKSPVQFSVWKAAVGLQPRDGTFGTRYQRSSEPTPWAHTHPDTTPQWGTAVKVSCALAQNGTPGMCEFWECLLCCLTYTLNNAVWECGG